MLRVRRLGLHGRTKAQHHRDTVRDNDLVVAGYLPVHFTYRMIHRAPPTSPPHPRP